MLAFYKKAILVSFGLIILALALTIVFFGHVFISDALTPARDSVIPWELETITDVEKGGTSSISVNHSGSRLDYNYVLTKDAKYPYVIAAIAFADLWNAERLVDLSRYSAVTFKARCEPGNVLAFQLYSFDPEVTDPENFSSYRVAESLFSCNGQWSDIEIDLRHMNVPLWWLHGFNVMGSDQNYWLNKVLAFSFVASRQGPIDTPATVQIGDMTLHARNWRYAWALGGVFLFICACSVLWLFNQYTRSLVADVQGKLQKDRPLIAYQQLSIDPEKDREKSLLLRFMAIEYADPEFSMEKTIAALGINRTKMNEILRKEIGLTFTGYLNKLRLTEAARLLSEKDKAKVSEIAYSVGYKSISYFNRLFKNEYGYAPKAFRSICRSDRARALRLLHASTDDDQPR